MIPPQLTARLIILGVSFLSSTVVPMLVQDKPRLKWAFDKLGPRVVSRVTEKVDQKFPGRIPVPHACPPCPVCK